MVYLGDCYFHSVYWNHRGEKLEKPKRHDEIRSSEIIGMMFIDDAHLQRCINGTTGIYYYESDLWDKEELRRQLHKLVDEVLK